MAGDSNKPSLERLAKGLLDVVPLIMRSIRAEMRAHRDAELSVPQFRVLNHVRLQGSVSLSELADHMGLTMPSTSTMIDVMVGRGLVDRRVNDSDRRKVAIEVTAKGSEAWASAWKATCESLLVRLGRLSESERRELETGLESLRRLF